MRASLVLLLLAAGCATSTADHVKSQEGCRVVGGYVKRVDGLENPKIRKLKDGTAYTVTVEGCTVVLYSGQKDVRTGRYDYQTFELKPGDQFVSSRPVSFVVIRETAAPPKPEPVLPR
jgi:hypothetical protein